MNTNEPRPFLNAYESIIARRTAHAYRDLPIDFQSLQRSLDAANHAPCHKLTFPWRFVRVGPKGRVSMAELAVQIKAETRPLSSEEAKRIFTKTMAPPELVVACQVKSMDPFRGREDYAACACAIQNFFISLASEGISGKWSTGAITRDLRTYRLLGLDPAALEVIGFLWAGMADMPPPIDRPPLESVVRTIP
ncbi:MAG: nitroreductase family protein [Phycisphaerales bacterium]